MNPMKGSLQFKTNYNFKVFRGDKLIQEENTHNVLLNQGLWKKWYETPNNSSGSLFARIQDLGLGSGTGTPQATDTGLFKHLWTVDPQQSTLLEVNDSTNTVTTRWVFEVPATTSYVGTITECGLRGDFSATFFYSHALIRDAEGNPISIQKTDLDKLIVTVDLSITISSADPDMIVLPISKTPFPRWMKFSGSYATFYPFNCFCRSSAYGKTDIVSLIQSPIELLQREVQLYTNRESYTGAEIDPYESLIRSTYQTVIESDNVRRCTGRMNQDAYAAGSVAYIKGLMFLGTFMVKLPNEKFFPTYRLENIEVGVATGGENQMLCPLDYFVEGSETIYKNGTALIRGIDYQVDAYNNHRALIELAESNDAIITGGGYLTSYVHNKYCRLFRPKLVYSSSANDAYSTYYKTVSILCSISTEWPLYFDMQKEVTINFLRVPLNSNYKYKIYSSTDGQAYNLHATHTFASGGSYIWDFAPVTARYFKLEIMSSSDGSVTHAPQVEYNSIDYPQYYYAMGFRTDGMIRFTTPLSVGDVITMDCSMDLPYKTSNNVIEYDFSLSL